ncbi:MAG: hypothetical protein PHS79_05265 [Patescibacteria group bacterium]|nr:hypothetical protein [Patescibacteria group bacterium]
MLKANVTTIQDAKVKLTLPDGQIFVAPLSSFEGTPKEGMSVALILAVPGADDSARQQLSKDLLNELMTE